MTVLKRDSQYHTYGDYLIWSRNFGDELIDGTAYVREPPSPGAPHQLVVGEVFHQIANALEDTHWRVMVAPLDIRLPKSTELDSLVDTVVQPDIFITGDPSKLDNRGMRGAPDWLVEVASPSTARYDQKKKIPIYERSGVREVWLVNPATLKVTIYRLQDGRYGRPTVIEMKGQTELAAVPGVVVDWDRLVARCL
ncbi:MAG: Uma2 family endonuclease [Proteobacteria bacterium]|nr:Uma2 family endonuclease [Pseudomonadota bacterium]